MKTFALTIAATLIASSSAFAGGLFDVDDAPIQYEQNQMSQFDNEATASIGFNAPASVTGDYSPKTNSTLFDVEDL